MVIRIGNGIEIRNRIGIGIRNGIRNGIGIGIRNGIGIGIRNGIGIRIRDLAEAHASRRASARRPMGKATGGTHAGAYVGT
ncbi:MAG: hypothetical protein JNK64_22420 [Myxococcales bacterium]|nr:hypothetical protein [Myxococcales bacterium]